MLGVLRNSYPDVPLLALTATATARVQADVCKILGMRAPRTFSQDFNRPNLVCVGGAGGWLRAGWRCGGGVVEATDTRTSVTRPPCSFTVRPRPTSKAAAFGTVLRYIRDEHDPRACGIVYCLSRDDCEALARWLAAQGVAADFYHAGMNAAQRVLVQNAWQRGDLSVVVATIGEWVSAGARRRRSVAVVVRGAGGLDARAAGRRRLRFTSALCNNPP
jgi:superfamily II DNA helicase RecQ